MVLVKTVSTSQGAAWVIQGWRIFMRNPGMWIAEGLGLVVAVVVLHLIPFVGGLVVSLISPVLMAGLLFAAREVDEGRPLEFGYLIRGFQESEALNGLLAIGGIVVVGTIASAIILAVFLGGAMMAAMQGDLTEVSAAVSGTGGLVGLLLAFAVETALAMAVIYAIPLVMFKKTPVGEAMRASVNACTRNFMPLLVFSVIYLVISVIASLPLMLGWVLLLPASIGMLYASYRDCFEG